MKNSTLRWLMLLGMIAILSNSGIQLYLLHQAFSEGQKKFSQTVHIALLEVVKKMYGHDIGNAPETGPVKKVSNDYYVVDVNDHIRADVLEYYLKTELRRFGIDADFEYGIYNCETDQMVYGNYISMDKKDIDETEKGNLAKYPDLVYYFGIRFPQQANYIVGSLKIWIILTSVSVIILLFFVFVIFTVLQQKRLSELQHDFVNNMTHEFKTPITSTKIALEYLRGSPIINADERFPRYMDMITSQMDHLNNHVERILEISRVDRRSFALQRKKINPVQLIEKVAGSFIDPKHILTFKLSDKTLQIFADEVHLTNVIISLIDNAIKYSKPGSTIEIGLSEQDRKAVFSVCDEGIGIDKKLIRKVFHKFYRVSTGDVHNVKGFGLGLYYVKRVCDRHGWRIHVDSTLNVGTKFSIEMPIING
jgi:two-component system, OmpR family, phosphate regulon sensor histidine kinase PhoR